MNALKQSALGDDDKAPWDETEVAGQKLRTVHIGAGLFAPTYLTTDQFFILASTPDYARQLLSQVKDSKPTLAASATYQQSISRLSANGISYGYADLRGLFEPVYAMARHGMSLIGSNAFVDTGKLPASETIARHLFPYVSATVAGPQAATSTSFSPLGKFVGLAAVGGGGVWVANTFGPQLQQAITPAWTKKSSNTAAPSPPPGNQTAPSQTPSTQ
jgi:hypothetical protein